MDFLLIFVACIKFCGAAGLRKRNKNRCHCFCVFTFPRGRTVMSRVVFFLIWNGDDFVYLTCVPFLVNSKDNWLCWQKTEVSSMRAWVRTLPSTLYFSYLFVITCRQIRCDWLMCRHGA